MRIIDIMPALHEAGKIKIGTGGAERTAKSGRKYREPKKLDHFIITSTERGPDGNFLIEEATMAKLTTAKGAKGPTEIPIRLLFDSIEENFDTSYSMYVGGKRICCGGGTGTNAKRRKTRKQGNVTVLTGETEEVPCGEKCEFYMGRGDGAKCKPYGILACILEDALNVGGVYKFRTTSRKTIQVIWSGLRFIQHITGGILAGLPLVLRFGKRPTTLPDGSKGTAPVVHVAFKGDIAALQQKAAEVATIRSRSQLKMEELRGKYARLTMLDTPEDEFAVNEEFHPESIAEDVRDVGERQRTDDGEPEDGEGEEPGDDLNDAPWNREEPAKAASGPAEAPKGAVAEAPKAPPAPEAPPAPGRGKCEACEKPSDVPICPECTREGWKLDGATGELYNVADRNLKGEDVFEGTDPGLTEGEKSLQREQDSAPKSTGSALDW